MPLVINPWLVMAYKPPKGIIVKHLGVAPKAGTDYQSPHMVVTIVGSVVINVSYGCYAVDIVGEYILYPQGVLRYYPPNNIVVISEYLPAFGTFLG